MKTICEICAVCDGHGYVRLESSNNPAAYYVTATCSACGGRGYTPTGEDYAALKQALNHANLNAQELETCVAELKAAMATALKLIATWQDAAGRCDIPAFSEKEEKELDREKAALEKLFGLTKP